MEQWYMSPKSSFDATADAIRAKTGSQASIEWTEDGFADAIEDIPSGSSWGEELLARTITTLSDNNQTVIGKWACRGCTALTTVNLPNVTTVGEEAFNGCSSLLTVSLLGWTTNNGGYQFYKCTSLQSINIPNLSYIGRNAFDTCTSLSGNFMFLSATGVGYGGFSGCSEIEGLDFPLFTKIEGAAFNGCSKLNTLVLRKSSVVTLDGINAFNNTPLASGGTGGTLYVPNSLISSYQSATNWSTILGYANNQIKSIESTHTDPSATIDLTTHYADGTLIE